MRRKGSTSTVPPPFGCTGSWAADSVPLALAERLLTIPEVAILLRIGRVMVYKLIRRGDLPAARQGNLFRVRGRDLIRYMHRRGRRANQGVSPWIRMSK